MISGFKKFRSFAVLVCLTSAIALSGCNRPPAGGTDYRIQHPISAQEKVFSLTITDPGSIGPATKTHLHRIRNFVANHQRRGRGPFLISHGKASTAQKSVITTVLEKAGVPNEMIFIQKRVGRILDSNIIELSFSGYAIKLPRCGDWSGGAGFNPTNRSHSDFGCSYQRNIGLMLSNPGDLSVAGDPVERDTQTSDRVIRTFREGKALGTPAPKLEQKKFSDVK